MEGAGRFCVQCGGQQSGAAAQQPYAPQQNVYPPPAYAPYPMHQPPAKKLSGGAIAGIVFAGVALFVALIVILAALSGNGTQTPTPPPMRDPPQIQQRQTNETPWGDDGPARGEWRGDVYTNEGLGLGFDLPDDWRGYSDASIDRFTNFGGTLALSDDIFIDMAAARMIEAEEYIVINLRVLYERLENPEITAAQYIEQLNELRAQDGDDPVEPRSGTTQIGTYEWHSFGMVTQEDRHGDIDIHMYWFIRMQDGFAQVVSIIYYDGFETLDGILALLDEPALLPPQDIDPALAGVWAWDGYERWQYMFFADGTGTRGIPGDTQHFTWSTQGDILEMDIEGSAFGLELWTFVIRGDVLTITSRQVAGMTYSYIRQDGVPGANRL